MVDASLSAASSRSPRISPNAPTPSVLLSPKEVPGRVTRRRGSSPQGQAQAQRSEDHVFSTDPAKAVTPRSRPSGTRLAFSSRRCNPTQPNQCCFRAVATVTEIRDPVVDDHSLTISSPCPSVLSAGGRERTSAHRAPIRLVPERQLACRARVPARATLRGRGAPHIQLLGHPRPGQPPPAQPDDTAVGPAPAPCACAPYSSRIPTRAPRIPACVRQERTGASSTLMEPSIAFTMGSPGMPARPFRTPEQRICG